MVNQPQPTSPNKIADAIRRDRLQEEFARLKALQTPCSLFRITCDRLGDQERRDFSRSNLDYKAIFEGQKSFLSLEEFSQHFPDQAPEKYLISYACKGLAKRPEDKEPIVVDRHLMLVVLGQKFPSKPPTFIWWTTIWHPNINVPTICLLGRPFALGLYLDQVVPEVGRMVQYQIYNVENPLNHEAADWASKAQKRFPIDERDILDATRSVKSPPAALVQLVPEGQVQMKDPTQKIEIVEETEQ